MPEVVYATAMEADIAARKYALPPPDWTVAEHAERRRMLSKETSELHGPYRLDVTPYWRRPLELYTDDMVEFIKVKKGSQLGYSELMNCIICYHIDMDPAPMITLFPTQEDARDWSIEKFTPMVRDTPCLQGKIKSRREKSGENTTNLGIRFTGGQLTLAWSNSASRLAAKSRRIIFIEEPDRCSTDAKREGTAIKLIIKRGDAFANRKVVMGGTPTLKPGSAIVKEMETTDWEYFWVPCPRCGGFQTLEWEMIHWEMAGGGDIGYNIHPIYGLNLPETAYLECKLCSGHINNDEKIASLEEGRWVATRPFKGQAGFDISGVYSPMPKATLMHGVQQYLEAKTQAELGDYNDMQVWVNTYTGQPFEEPAEEEFNEEDISHLRESIGTRVPEPVRYLTAFIDPGGHNMAIEVVGWGDHSESWGLWYHEMPIGLIDQKKDNEKVFEDLDYYMFKMPFVHESGRLMKISAVGIDTGNWTKECYEWVKKHRARNRVYACKGDDGWEKDWFRKTHIKTSKIMLHLLYVDQIKLTVMRRMLKKQKGPGYMHINANYQSNWEQQMTSNRLMTKWRNGQPVRYWFKYPHLRDEALDCRVGNIAVREIALRHLEKDRRGKGDRPAHPFAPEGTNDPMVEPVGDDQQGKTFDQMMINMPPVTVKPARRGSAGLRRR